MIGLVESRIRKGAGGDPYHGMTIANIEELVMFRDLINTGLCIWNGVETDTYKGNAINAGGEGNTWWVIDDIDMSSVCGDGVGNWTPIGTAASPFKGVLIGLEYTITGLYIVDNIDYQGLFGHINGASITDISVLNATVTAKDYAAILCANYTNTLNDTAIVENCTTQGVIAASQYAGGVFGRAVIASAAYTTIIRNLLNLSGSITVSTGYGGGVIAIFSNEGLLNDCINYADILGNKPNCGGVVGMFSSYTTEMTFNRLVNYGDLQVSAQSAGVVGRGHAAYLYFNDCINYGDIEHTNDRIAGIHGTTERSDAAHELTYTRCVNVGKITQVANTTAYNVVAGIAAYINGICIFRNCQNEGAITGYGSRAGIAHRTAEAWSCINAGEINASGLAAGISTFGGKFYYCKNLGNIKSNSRAMGICVANGQRACDYCTNTGNITVENTTTTERYAAGICYLLGAYPVRFCRNDGVVSIHAPGTKYIGSIAANMGSVDALLDSCLSTGTIAYSGAGTVYRGSILGRKSAAGTIADNYYDSTISAVGGINNADVAGQAVGKATANLLGDALKDIGAGWTTANWVFTAGEYPTPIT